MKDKRQLEQVVVFLDKQIEQTRKQVERLGAGVGADLLEEWLEEVQEMRDGAALLAKSVKD